MKFPQIIDCHHSARFINFSFVKDVFFVVMEFPRPILGEFAIRWSESRCECARLVLLVGGCRLRVAVLPLFLGRRLWLLSSGW
jgi:hypothetical protein